MYMDRIENRAILNREDKTKILKSIDYSIDEKDKLHLINLNSKEKSNDYLLYLDLSERVDFILNIYEAEGDFDSVKDILTVENDNNLRKLRKFYGNDYDYLKVSKVLKELKLNDNKIMDKLIEIHNLKRLSLLKSNYNKTKPESILKCVSVIMSNEKISGRYIVESVNGSYEVVEGALVGNILNKVYEDNDITYLDELLKTNINNLVQKHMRFAVKHGLDEFKVDTGDKVLRVLAKKMLSGEGIKIVLEISDISGINKSEELHRSIAYYDALTGLANKELFFDTLETCIEESARLERKFGLLFIDIDDFKIINDTYGHRVGDEVLKIVATKLQDSVRTGDLVARYYSGDEFVIICRSVNDKHDLEIIARRIIESITSKPFFINDNNVSVSLSIGISLFPEHSDNSEEIVICADLAMYEAKSLGKSAFRFYNNSMKLEELKKKEIKNDLNNAIDRGELYLEYMLQYDSDKGKYIGVESLMRWNHPDKGVISPLEFIGVAEDSGIILEMGYWALDEGLKNLKKLHDLGFDDLVLGVNFTDSQFRDEFLIEKVLELTEKNGIDKKYLMLEISEKTSMWEVERTSKILTDLRDNGVKVCIDDFGTGYSSLKYLHEYPLTTLKIDKSFVSNVQKENTNVIKTLLSLSNTLGISVMAEGVENKEQYEILKSIGCKKFQGYYIGYPMLFADLYEMLDNGNKIK